MKAITLGASGVQCIEIAPPSPKSNQILVKVHACGMNRSDLLETQGQSFGHLDGDTKVLGGEFAGEIVELGNEVEGFYVGDRVMCRGGSGWAEYAVANWRRAAPMGDANIPWSQAACVQGALQTIHDAIVTNGQFKAGQSVLIQGASSGAGLMGLQVARAMGAQLVIGTSATPARRPRLSEFGANLSLDSSNDNWTEQVLDATEGKGVDVTVDMLSGDFVNKNMQVTVVHGHVINIGRLAGMRTDFDCDLHAARRLHYIGTTGRSRSMDEHEAVRHNANKDLWDAVVSGEIASPIDKIYPLEEAANALARMNANEHFGKIVLQVL